MTLVEVLLLLLAIALAYLLLRQQPKPSQKKRSMGCSPSAPAASSSYDDDVSAPAGRSRSRREVPSSHAIGDNYRTLAEVELALRKAGLESSDIIVAVDFTKSNTWQGERTFGGRSLHALSDGGAGGPGAPRGPGVGEFDANPYQQVIATLCDVLLAKLDDDAAVPLYGFGDQLTGNRKVFLANNERECRSKEELLGAYADAAGQVTLSGPTSFAPIIYEAIDVCRATGKYHVLFILADGVMDDVAQTTEAIVAASKHPLSICMIGLGDGPWDQMDTFDDDIPERDFDNFQFVSFTRLQQQYRDPATRAMRFALESLMELPEQYQTIKRRGMLGRAPQHDVQFQYRLRGKHIFPASYVAAPSSGVEGVYSAVPGGPQHMPPTYASSAMQ